VQQIGGHGVVRDGNIAAARIQGFQAYVENLQQQIHDLKHEMEVRLKDKDEKIAEKDVMIKDLNQTIHDLRNDLAQKVHAKKAEKTKNFKLNEQLKACQKDLSQKIKDMERLGALVDNSHGLDQGVNDNKRKADAASEEDPEVKRGKADDAETTE
jgi:ATP-dependent Lon protease